MKKSRGQKRSIQKKWLSGRTKISAGFVICFLLFFMVWYNGYGKADKADAAEQKTETVNLRIIGTTDLHGQLNSKDYELGVDYNNGGLARVMDLITRTRNELPRENTFTLDAGDVLYDYTTEYIFSENQEAIQPIYKAMALVGYDAITLGNHEFDYGYEYILRQLNGSGMRNITVVSNVTDSKTGEYPFLEVMLITRQMKTSSGKTAEVTVGIIGQTIPTLTAKTHSYAGILKTEDMVENAKAKAVKLKEMGADIVIALSHTGIGPENPELNFKNVAYAISKIPEIDVVVCGHEHNLFPTTDMTSPYYRLPNVDKKTSLMNGKNVIMAGDRGEAIGVVDLKLEVTGDTVQIVDRSSEIKMVTAENTTENKTIAAYYGSWEEKLSEYFTEVLGELKADEIIQNYFGMLGDNPAIQLLNNSKLQYALNFANTTGTAYKKYPIIAASTYASYGANSVYDFINIREKITESDLTSIQPYNNYLYVYTITGKQLKEWLEWSASAYETLGGSKAWADQTMSGLMKAKGKKSLIQEEWLNDWSNFFIFDGVDYVVDPSVEPRYDFSGNKISNSRRIRSLKYNGIDVKDDTVFLLATNKITIPVEANSGVEKQAVLGGFNRSQSILGRYIDYVHHCGNIMPGVDNNWRVGLPNGYQFIVKTPAYAEELFKNSPWYVEYLIESKNYRYYTAAYPSYDKDVTSPNIVMAPAVTSATASEYQVAVLVTDESEIKQLRVKYGEIDLDYEGWPYEKTISGNSFTVWQNGVYSVYAEDIYGNKTVKRLVVDNFNDNLLSKPTVVSYTNRKTKITGTAEPNATIIFDAYTGVYESTVDRKGSFSYALPSQPSGTVVSVYIKDEAKGLESERVVVPVKRTGPNQPVVSPILNNVNYIQGSIKDDDASIIAIIDDTVYVSNKGGRALYEKAAEIYNSGLKIVESDLVVDSNGFFLMSVPPISAGKTVTVYSLDHLSRTSRVTSSVVSEIVPNAPVVYEVSNIEKSISGHVPDADKTYDITLTVGKNTYKGKTDQTGKFTFKLKEQLYADQLIEVTASDVKNDAIRNSYTTRTVVNDIEKYMKTSSTNLTINRITSKTSIISGYYYDGGTVYVAVSEGKGENFKNSLYSVSTDELYRYQYYMETTLKPGMKVYVMTRFVNGRILLSNGTDVIPGRPDMPMLLKDITNTDKLVQVVADKDCEIILTIGSKSYTTKKYTEDKANNRYVYSLDTDRDKSGTPVTVTAANSAGTSEKLISAIIKTAPDSPVVKPVKAGDAEIRGTIELLDYIAPAVTPDAEGKENIPAGTDVPKETDPPGTGTTVNAQTGEKTANPQVIEEAIPETLKNAPKKVATTQTRVFAQIGNKTYEGTIDKDGNFTIKVPKQKAGTAIKLWGTNKAGRGPLVKVVVAKK